MADGDVGVVSLRHQPAFREGLKGFLDQSRILANLDQPALVRVLRTWEQRGTAYMAMPLYEGLTLNDTFRHSSRPSEAWLKAMLGPLLDALAALHRVGCYPCDVTPENVVVGDGGPLLFDVGIVRRILARATRGRVVVRDTGFAALEQYSRDPAMPEGPWTDVYAVAALLRRAITGEPPVSALTRADSDDMPPLGKATEGYSESFLKGIDLGLGVRPQQRPLSIAEFRQTLGIRSLESAPIAIPTPAPESSAALAPKRGPKPRPQVDSTQKTRPKKPVQRRSSSTTLERASQHARAAAAGPAPASGTTPRRFMAWVLGPALLVGLAGMGLLWTSGGAERSLRPVGENSVAMRSTTVREPSSPPVATPEAAAPTTAPSASKVESTASELAAPATTLATAATLLAAPDKSTSAAPKTGSVQFAIRPWGEILIDGKKRGVSPPVKTLSIPEGRHRIEIRNSTLPPYASDIDVSAGGRVSIVHSFNSP
jgi:serine/threonine protein kinase